MKKSIVILTVTLGLAVSSFGQGTVTFGNTGGTKISVNSSVGGPLNATTSGAAGSYYYALFATTTATAVDGSTAAIVGVGDYVFNAGNASSWAFQDYGASTASAGRFASLSADTSGNTTLATIAGGNVNTYYVIVGWSSNIGSTWQNVQSFLAGSDVQNSAPVTTGWVGESTVGGPTPAGIPGSTAAATLFGGASPYITGFGLGDVTVIPEPSSIALGVMGAASLLALRRKKA